MLWLLHNTMNGNRLLISCCIIQRSSGSDYEEHHIPQASLTKTSSVVETPQTSVAQTSAQLPTVLPNISLPATAQTSLTPIRANGAMSSTIPLPLLILNHGIPTQPQAQEKKPTDNNTNKTPSEEPADNSNVTSGKSI